MKLHSVTEMGQAAGLCCRQSRLRGAVGGLIVCACFVGAVFLWRHLGAPWFVWGGSAALAGLFVPILLRDIFAKFGSTNWVLWVRDDGLWVNLLSFQTRRPADSATALHLDYQHITHAHRHIDTWSTPSARSGSTHWKQESLDLHPASGDMHALSLALAREHSSSAGAHRSVTLLPTGVIRIAWRGNNNDVVPALDHVFAELSHRVTVSDTTRTDRPDWRRLGDAELEEQIEHLVRWGDQLGAIELLIRRRGFSTTEAQKFVDEMASRI